MVRVTVDLDEVVLAAALRHAHGKTEGELINEALGEYARRRRLRAMIRFRGRMRWEGDLDSLRGRVKPRADR